MTQFLKTAPEITAWLARYGIEDYTLIPDKNYGFKVNVEGSVFLFEKNLSSIPVKFNEVTGFFDCNSNHLTALDFAPVHVGQYFDCGRNKLTSLLGAPKEVGHHFICSFNRLTSLEHCPDIVGEHFDCCHNTLLNFEYCPQRVESHFFCEGNEALGNIQKIIHFKKIYQFHEQFLNIKKEKQLLTDCIETPLNNPKQHKI